MEEEKKEIIEEEFENREQPVDDNAPVTEFEDVLSANKSAGSLGKFKDAESMISAYNNLQAEFTRKCQRLSELEKSLEQSQITSTQESLENYVFKNDEIKSKVYALCVKEIMDKKSPPLIVSTVGAGLASLQPTKPTNLSDAKEMVSTLFGL